MSRINSNVPSIIAQRVLTTQNNRLNTSMHRLSTGLRINAGRDDPAGLIASEKMRAELEAVSAAKSNITRARNIVAVAESGLQEISSLLKDLEGLIDSASNESGITDDEREANQVEIDAILESINRIASSTELQGRRLLDGGLAYRTSSVTASQVANLRINSARIPHGDHRSVTINVITSAQLGEVAYTGSTITGSTRIIEVVGNLGREVFTFASGTTVSSIVSAVNQAASITGVSAALSGTAVLLNSTDYGSDQFVRVRALSGTFTMANDITEDYGVDVVANVDGIRVDGSGLNLATRTVSLSADIQLSAGMATQTAANATFEITGGGARFSISPNINLGTSVNIGIDSVATTSLGDSQIGLLYTLATGQENALAERNYETSQQILRAAVDQVSTLRGRLGAFERDTLDTTEQSLNVQYENVAAAESAIRDADFAVETSNLTRSQILVQAAMLALQQANRAPQNVLALLQG